MNSYTKRILKFDLNKDSVSLLRPEIDPNGRFVRVLSNQNIERLFDISDDSVFFYDMEESQTIMFFDSRCRVYGPAEIRDRKIVRYEEIGHLFVNDNNWSVEVNKKLEGLVKAVSEHPIAASSTMIAEIKFFDIWYEAVGKDFLKEDRIEKEIEIELRFPQEIIERINALSKETGRSTDDIVSEAIEKYIKKNNS